MTSRSIASRLAAAAIAAVPLATLALSTAVLSSCTVVKPIAGALVFPFVELGSHFDRDDDDDDEAEQHSELPPAAVFAAAPLLIPLNFAYYSAYGAIGGLFSGFVSDLNLITGHGSLDNSKRTLLEPLRTNALAPK